MKIKIEKFDLCNGSFILHSLATGKYVVTITPGNPNYDDFLDEPTDDDTSNNQSDNQFYDSFLDKLNEQLNENFDDPSDDLYYIEESLFIIAEPEEEKEAKEIIENEYTWEMTPILLSCAISAYITTRFLIFSFLTPFIYLFSLLLLVVIFTAETVTKMENTQKAFRQEFTALNTVIGLYNKKGYIPSVEEAKYESILCADNKLFPITAFATMQLIGYFIFVILAPTGIIFFLIEIALLLVSLVFPYIFPFNIIGYYIETKLYEEPSEKDYHLAIHALDELLLADES